MQEIDGRTGRSSWQVPPFRIHFWRGRQHTSCVIIPVINEGERILSLLSRMAALDIAGLADVILVDAGSTDGSLNPGVLQARCVRGFLEKTGPGRLSAQLRCGYAFALDEGYDQIITIDGNDKDDPESIPRFIEAMARGIDFVQASRFIPGGVALNTPRSRDLAIRLLHAPVLAFFSGFPWTDTTQGFRAYSRRLLLDPGIAPFRDVFMTYELLAYLNYRAPRLGHRCEELATARRYPEGKVPTKINSLRSYFSLILILFSACLGRYNPPQYPANCA